MHETKKPSNLVLEDAEVFQILTDTADYVAPVEYNPEAVSDKRLPDLLRERDEYEESEPDEAESILVFDEDTISDVPSENLNAVAERNSTAVAIVTPDEEEHQIDEDFEKIRKNTNTFLKTANSAIGELLALARASDNPDVYNSLNQMLKTASEINSSLIENHGKKRKAKVRDQSSLERNGIPVQANQQNNYFVGTTAELAAILNKKA